MSCILTFQSPVVRIDQFRVCRSRSTLRAHPRSQTASSSPSTHRTFPALKEWAPLCKAIGKGKQTVLFRKGGIQEPLFQPKHSMFLLFPTSFHTDTQLLKQDAQMEYEEDCLFDPKKQNKLAFSIVAKITAAWHTTEPFIVSALESLHICGDAFLEKRLRWRSSSPLTVLELRAYKLTTPLIVEPCDDYWGCFSWVDVKEEDFAINMSKDGELERVAVPVLKDDEFAEKQRICREQLSKIQYQIYDL